MQVDVGRLACQLAATAVPAHAAHQTGLGHLRKQPADDHRMGRQAGCQLLGRARSGLTDQMRHHVQGVRKWVG